MRREIVERNARKGMHTPNGPLAHSNEAPRTRMESLAGNVHSSIHCWTLSWSTVHTWHHSILEQHSGQVIHIIKKKTKTSQKYYFWSETPSLHSRLPYWIDLSCFSNGVRNGQLPLTNHKQQLRKHPIFLLRFLIQFRILPYFPHSAVCSFICHSRDISTFIDDLMV